MKVHYSIVNYAEIAENSDFRLAAEYYHPVSLAIHRKIRDSGGISFFQCLTKFSSGKNLPQTPTGKFKFIRTQNVRTILVSDNGMSHTDRADELTEIGELLFVRVGDVGDSSVVTPTSANSTVSDNVLRLKVTGINPFFCSVFFNSTVGQTYFKRVFKGTSQGLISRENFRDILIPQFSEKFQNAMEFFCLEADSLHQQSVLKSSDAEKLLLVELNLANWQPKPQLAFVKNYSDVQGAERFDADYFQPRYDDIVNAIKGYPGGWDTLGNLVTLEKCVEVGSRKYRETGIPFVRVSNLSPFEITHEKYISEELYAELEQHQPKQGEILLSKDATPGIAHHLREQPTKMIPAGGILRLKHKSELVRTAYLTLVLNSILGQEQVSRDVGGSVIPHWRPSQVAETLIPILPDEKQAEIERKVTESFNLRQQSKHLLECAKRAVDIAIEADEETALRWLETGSKSTNAAPGVLRFPQNAHPA